MHAMLYTLGTALTIATSASAFCTDFQVIPQTYSERGSTITNLTNLTAGASYSYRISNAIICNETTAAAAPPACLSGTCQPQIFDGAIIQQPGVMNVTVGDDEKDAAFTLISQVAQIPFPSSANTTMGAPGAETYNSCISPTWAGYLSFSPLMNCVNGVMSGCSDSTITDGTLIRACAPLVPSTSNQLSGSIFFEQTSEDTANSLGPVPNPETPERDVFVGSYVSPSPMPTGVVSTAVPVQPGDSASPATPTPGH